MTPDMWQDALHSVVAPAVQSAVSAVIEEMQPLLAKAAEAAEAAPRKATSSTASSTGTDGSVRRPVRERREQRLQEELRPLLDVLRALRAAGHSLNAQMRQSCENFQTAQRSALRQAAMPSLQFSAPVSPDLHIGSGLGLPLDLT